MRKCDMCYERQSAGKLTACAEACPTGATKNGDRDALIAEARQRMAEKPDQYYQQDLWLHGSRRHFGAVPFGGAVRADRAAHQRAAGASAARLTWRVLELVPDVVSTGTVLLGGIWWITNRRAEVAEEGGERR